MFLNADHLPDSRATPTLAQLSEHALEEMWSQEFFATQGIESAEQWWDDLSRVPGLAALQTQRARRAERRQRPQHATLDDHVAACEMPASGETGTIWQALSDRVLVAVR